MVGKKHVTNKKTSLKKKQSTSKKSALSKAAAKVGSNYFKSSRFVNDKNRYNKDTRNVTDHNLKVWKHRKGRIDLIGIDAPKDAKITKVIGKKPQTEIKIRKIYKGIPFIITQHNKWFRIQIENEPSFVKSYGKTNRKINGKIEEIEANKGITQKDVLDSLYLRYKKTKDKQIKPKTKKETKITNDKEILNLLPFNSKILDKQSINNKYSIIKYQKVKKSNWDKPLTEIELNYIKKKSKESLKNKFSDIIDIKVTKNDITEIYAPKNIIIKEEKTKAIGTIPEDTILFKVDSTYLPYEKINQNIYLKKDELMLLDFRNKELKKYKVYNYKDGLSVFINNEKIKITELK